MKKLGPKQARFVEEYLVDLNATQAAIRAGYSRKTAEAQGSRLLRNVKVADAIATAQAKRSERLEITADMWLRELWLIGRSDLKNYMDIDPDTGAIRAKGFEEMPEGTSRALEAIKENRVIKEDADGNKSTVYDKVEFKLHSKNQALEMIGKALGFLKEKFEHSGPDGGPILMIMPTLREKSDKK
ncbi:MAG: terminase small subunit [Candidatus Aminicenantes bacterium]|nr:terminase small subunit [Candidatus Aminicenantes bacterium]